MFKIPLTPKNENIFLSISFSSADISGWSNVRRLQIIRIELKAQPICVLFQQVSSVHPIWTLFIDICHQIEMLLNWWYTLNLHQSNEYYLWTHEVEIIRFLQRTTSCVLMEIWSDLLGISKALNMQSVWSLQNPLNHPKKMNTVYIIPFPEMIIDLELYIQKFKLRSAMYRALSKFPLFVDIKKSNGLNSWSMDNCF